MRLDKFLCETKNISRKDAKQYVKKGYVSINGTVTKDSSQIIKEDEDNISFNGERLVYEKNVYYMLNKPSGVVSATKDSCTTVIDLLKEENRDDLFPVGRLDKDTVGLLFITNDGAWAHHLTSPNHNVEKEYLIKSKHPLSEADIFSLENGVRLNEETLCKPAKVKVIDSEHLILTISEGMYHQVKRMLIAVNNEVLELKRISEGPVKLDDNLKPGEYRRLSLDEIELLKK